MQEDNRIEKNEYGLDLSVPKELLLHSFMSDYIRAFIVDLEQDTYELLFEREEDPVLSEIIRQADKYSAFNKLNSRLLPEPAFTAWREVAGSRENIRSMLKMQECFSFVFPRRGMESWMKVEVRLLEERDGKALLLLELKTGRTHQIRVHLSAIGCPVRGDFLYGEEQPEEFPGRFALHSAVLETEHPVTGEKILLTSRPAWAEHVPDSVLLMDYD